jgi:hypothetical protein
MRSCSGIAAKNGEPRRRCRSSGSFQISFIFRQCLSQHRIRETAAGALACGQTHLKPITERHQFIDPRDDAVLLGKWWDREGCCSNSAYFRL